MKIIELSYPLSENNAVLPSGRPKPEIIPSTRMPKDGNNTSIVRIFTHTSTHLDVSFHFNPQGYTVEQLSINHFIFLQPLLIKCIKNEGENVEQKDLSIYQEQLTQCDLLMIYTGFSKYRSKNQEKYLYQAPGLSLDAAKYLRNNFSLKGLALDLFSVENMQEAKKKGFPVHKTLLGSPVPKKFVIVEDVNLSKIMEEKINRVYAIPLRLKGLDGSPATVWAEIK